jgi:hypothetical protein
MSARRRATMGLALLVSFAFTLSIAHAEDPAEALTKQGIELRRGRRDAEALGAFRQAYRLAPAPRILAQIALAEQALGLWVDAERDLVQALQSAKDPWVARHEEALDSGLSAIRAHLASLEVTANVAGAELLVNGERAGSLPSSAPLRVVAGSLVIEVRALGYAPMRRQTSAEPGGSVREAVELVPLAPETGEPGRSVRPTEPIPPPPSLVLAAVPAQPRRVTRNAGLVLIGGGAIGISAGSYFGVRTLSTKSQRDSEGACNAELCNATGVALDEEARSLALRSTVWFTAGIAAAAGGVVLLWLSRPGHGTSQHSLGVAPQVGPDRAGLSVGGSW